MKDLIIKLNGEITESNFDEWKSGVLTEIEAANKTLETDEDFAEAEQITKKLKSAEQSLITAKQSALDQTADIKALFDAIDEITNASRETRLNLDKQVKSRKEEIKAELVNEFIGDAESVLAGQPDDYKAVRGPALKVPRQFFEEAVKGKRVISSMRTALSDALAVFTDDVQSEAAVVQSSSEVLNKIEHQYRSLFQDRVALLSMHPATLSATIEKRIAVYEKEQAEEKAKKENAKEEVPAVVEQAPVDDFDMGEQEPPFPDEFSSGTKPVYPVVDNSPATITRGAVKTGSVVTDGKYQLIIQLVCQPEDAKKIAQKINAEYGPMQQVAGISLKLA